MNDILMEVRDLSYRYPDQTLALDHVNLIIRRHERLAIMGSNGSGKSTLFLNLNGVYKPTEGQILYEGQPVDYSRKGLLELRRKVGIVFQEPDNQLFCASVAGEISFGLYNLGLEEPVIRARVDEVCDRLSITPFRSKPTHFLSGGQKKRVSIADILVMQPELLILDEPFSALDPKHAQMIDQILRTLSDSGITVVISTHEADRIYPWADRVVVLNNSHILADGTPDEIFSDVSLLTAANLEQPTLLKVSQTLHRAGILPQNCHPRTAQQLEQMLK